MSWLCELLALSRYTLKSPRTMGSLKCCRASLRSVRCYNLEGGRYALTRGVQVSPVTIYQLIMFGLW